jgi:hypothetical protein
MTILRSDYLGIVDRLITREIIESLDDQKIQITRATRFCAAKLLQVFERLTNWKKEAYKKIKECWFWIPIIKSKSTSDRLPSEVESRPMPFRSLHDELQGEHCKDVIRGALALLKSFSEQGTPLLSCTHNPHDPQCRTYWYKLNSDWLERLKASLGAKGDLPTLQDGSPTLEGEIPTIISEINSETFQETLSEREQKVEEQNSEVGTQFSVEPERKLEGRSTNQQYTGGDLKSSAAAPIAKLIKKSGALYPTGDWMNADGQLHEDFVRTQAKLWCVGESPKSKAFAAMEIEDVMSCVQSCYAKSPEKLAIDWQAYCAKNHRYFQSVSLRLQSGASIPESEQQTILSKFPALAHGFATSAPALPPQALPPAKRPSLFRDLLRGQKAALLESSHREVEP